jgi:uncharacterized membrane protein YgcG
MIRRHPEAHALKKPAGTSLRPFSKSVRVALASVRLWAIVATFLGVGVGLSACSIGSDGPNVVQPAKAGPKGECYYVTSPKECKAWDASGTPTPITSQWLATYFLFYSSGMYRGFVPGSLAGSYSSTISSFKDDDETLINQDADNGTWNDADGDQWTGDGATDPDSGDSADDSTGVSDDDNSSGDFSDGGDNGDGGDDGGGDGGGGDDGGGDGGGGDFGGGDGS